MWQYLPLLKTTPESFTHRVPLSPLSVVFLVVSKYEESTLSCFAASPAEGLYGASSTASPSILECLVHSLQHQTNSDDWNDAISQDDQAVAWLRKTLFERYHPCSSQILSHSFISFAQVFQNIHTSRGGSIGLVCDRSFWVQNSLALMIISIVSSSVW